MLIYYPEDKLFTTISFFSNDILGENWDWKMNKKEKMFVDS